MADTKAKRAPLTPIEARLKFHAADRDESCNGGWGGKCASIVLDLPIGSFLREASIRRRIGEIMANPFEFSKIIDLSKIPSSLERVEFLNAWRINGKNGEEREVLPIGDLGTFYHT